MFGNRTESDRLEAAINGWAREVACLEPVIRQARMAYLEDLQFATGLDGDYSAVISVIKEVHERANALIASEDKLGDLYPPEHVTSDGVQRRISEIFKGDYERLPRPSFS